MADMDATVKASESMMRLVLAWIRSLLNFALGEFAALGRALQIWLGCRTAPAFRISAAQCLCPTCLRVEYHDVSSTSKAHFLYALLRLGGILWATSNTLHQGPLSQGLLPLHLSHRTGIHSAAVQDR